MINLLALREIPEILYLPHIVQFANFEFLIAIKDPKLAREGVLYKIFKHKIGVITCTPSNDFGGTREGVNSP